MELLYQLVDFEAIFWYLTKLRRGGGNPEGSFWQNEALTKISNPNPWCKGTEYFQIIHWCLIGTYTVSHTYCKQSFSENQSMSRPGAWTWSGYNVKSHGSSSTGSTAITAIMASDWLIQSNEMIGSLTTRLTMVLPSAHTQHTPGELTTSTMLKCWYRRFYESKLIINYL